MKLLVFLTESFQYEACEAGLISFMIIFS